MSRNAEDVSAAASALDGSLDGTRDEPSLNATDEIANLLVGADEPEIKDDDKKEETPVEASTDEEGEETNDEEAKGDEGEGEETTLELVADGDPTWEGVLGVSEEALSFDESGNIAGFRTKVNGEEEIVSTTDLIAGFQNNKANTLKGQEHAKLVEDFNVQKGQVEEIYASKLESVDALSKHFEKLLISDYENVNWEKLRVEDPAEYAAARHDFSVKAGELKRIKDDIAANKQSLTTEANDANVAKRQTYMKTQYDQMLLNNPEWSDEKVRKTAEAAHKAFVKDQYGFGDEDWDMVFDSRIIELIKDAKKYHEGATVAAKKTPKTLPKFQKSRGRGAKPAASKLEKLTAAAKKATGANKRDLQAGAVAELLTGG